MNVQVQSESEVSIVFSGDTYNLRFKFVECGVAGGYVNPAGMTPEEKGPYVPWFFYGSLSQTGAIT